MGTKPQSRNGIAAGIGMIVLAVSIFYGFTIWVVSSFIVSGWFNDLILSYSHTWWVFLAYLTFGLALGVYANRRSAPAPAFSA